MPLIGARRALLKRPAIITGGTPPAFPAIPNLMGRYLAAYGVTTSGGNVTAAQDWSSQDNNLVNNGTVPFTASGYNSLPSFNFEDTGGLISTDFTFSGSPAAFSAFAVLQMQSGADNYGGIVSYASPGQSADWNNLYGFNITRYQTNSQLITSWNSSQSGPSTFNTNQNYRVGVVLGASGGSTSYSMFIDGSLADTGGLGSGSFAPSSGGNFGIGTRWQSSSWSGNWYGVMVELDIFAGDITSYVTTLDSYYLATYGA